MPNASKTDLNEVDETFSPADVPVGISAVLGIFKRGPINDPSIVVNSWTQFSKVFGGLIQGADDAVIVKRCLERGSQLRVVNIKHYTNIAAADSLTATLAVPATGKTIALAGALIAANLLTVTINTVPVSQVFTVSSDNTMQLLVTKIAQTLPGVVSKAAYLGGNKLLITPITGITLTVTAVVTLGVSQAATTIGTVNTLVDSAAHLIFGLTPKYPGADYNNLQVTIAAASNGDANSFDVIIDHLVESNLQEKYPNIKIIGSPTSDISTYLNPITNGSQLMDVVYADLSAIAGQIRPVNTVLKYDTGTDGGAVVDTDFLGDSGAKTGVYALDPYDDFSGFGSVNSNSVVVLQGLASYASNRKDCWAALHIDNTYLTEAQVTAFRDSTFIDSTYASFWCGGVIITDSFTLKPRSISEIGDVLGTAAYSDASFGAWYSFAGKKRGGIINAVGVVNNFGLASNYAGRNLLANHQVNCAINKKGKLQLSGNFTAQLGNSELSFLNVRKMLLYAEDIIGPIADAYIEEPNDPTSWLKMFNEIKPELKALKTKRAIADWDYQGDQFITDVSKAVVNQPSDIDQGKYVANIFVKSIVSLQWIQINLILTPSGVSFEDNLATVGQ